MFISISKIKLQVFFSLALSLLPNLGMAEPKSETNEDSNTKEPTSSQISNGQVDILLEKENQKEILIGDSNPGKICTFTDTAYHIHINDISTL
jgi:hypothetical protein